MSYTFYAHFSSLVRRDGLERALDFAESLGCQGIEPLEGAPSSSLTFPTIKSAREARKILESRGMHVSCWSVGTELERDGAVDSLKRQCELAAELGSPYLHHTVKLALTLNEGSPSLDELLESVLPRAVEVAKCAEGCGISCIYENQGMYINGLEGFGCFYSAVKSEVSSVGVCADLGNSMFVDVAPLDFVRKFAADVRHVHVKDYLRHSAKPDVPHYVTRAGAFIANAIPGEGSCDVGECITYLSGAGYAGDYALELDGLEFPSPFREAAAKTINLCDSHAKNREKG